MDVENHAEAVACQKKSGGYAIVETTERGRVCVVAAPRIWIKGNILYWPKTTVIDRRNPTEPDINEWNQFVCVIMKDFIGQRFRFKNEISKLNYHLFHHS